MLLHALAADFGLNTHYYVGTECSHTSHSIAGLNSQINQMECLGNEMDQQRKTRRNEFLA